MFALINMGEERIVPVVPELSSCNHLSVVRGHHVYKEFWVPVVGEELQVLREERNEHDRTAVSVQKSDLIVGHLPRDMARVVYYFLQREGTTGTCIIIG